MKVKRSRMQYLIAFYIMGYIISLVEFSGEIPGIYYFIPVRIIALCLALLLGNAVYYTAEEKYEPLMATIRMLKYIPVMFIILALSGCARMYLYNTYNINIDWIIGM
ncbi:MAG: hypothetical protein N4A47_04165 [Clostridia bacterium]|jgi:biotin transporter BioY|nr:hypothetical protein [Clostridia bacterium]